jgi:hypothetical protein
MADMVQCLLLPLLDCIGNGRLLARLLLPSLLLLLE